MSTLRTHSCSSPSQAIFLTSMLMALFMRFALFGLRLLRHLFFFLCLGLQGFKGNCTENLQSVPIGNASFPTVRFTGIAAALFYLRHLRSCAASASGSQSSGGSTGRTASDLFDLHGDVFDVFTTVRFFFSLCPDVLSFGICLTSVFFLLLSATCVPWSFCKAFLCFCNSHRWVMDLIILLSSSEPLPLLSAWHLLECPLTIFVFLMKFFDIHFRVDLCRSVSAAFAWHVVATGDALAFTAALCSFCRPSFPGQDDPHSDDNGEAAQEALEELLLDEALAAEPADDPDLQEALRLSAISFAEEQVHDHQDLELASHESVAQDQRAQRRHDDADLVLFSLGDITDSSGHEGSVTVDPVPGNGWCFFAACCRELGLDEVHYSVLGCLSLTLLAMRKAEFSVFVGEDIDGEAQGTAIRRDVISQVPVYATCLEDLSAFDLYVLDKFEGVISGDFSNERRYADNLEMKVFLQECGLQMAVLNSAGDDHSIELPSQRPWSPDTVSSLQQGNIELLLVHYSEGAYLHYDAVCFEDGSSWQVSAEVRARVRTVLSACDTWTSLMEGDFDLARTLLLSALLPVRDSIFSMSLEVPCFFIFFLFSGVACSMQSFCLAAIRLQNVSVFPSAFVFITVHLFVHSIQRPLGKCMKQEIL